MTAPSTMTDVALRSAFLHAPGISGAAATKSMISRSAATRRGAARLLASGMKINAEPNPETRGAGYERDSANSHCSIGAEIARDQAETGRHARNVPPVLLVTSATILAPTASIS